MCSVPDDQQHLVAPVTATARRRHRITTAHLPVMIALLTMWYYMVLLTMMLSPAVQGTDVTWTAGPDQQQRQAGAKETAATAPRSQRYWDEHGIERPDYAKTDSELRQHEPPSLDPTILGPRVVVLIVIVLLVGYHQKKRVRGGTRLGTSGSANNDATSMGSVVTRASKFFSKTPSVAEARAARLARFEATATTSHGSSSSATNSSNTSETNEFRNSVESTQDTDQAASQREKIQ